MGKSKKVKQNHPTIWGIMKEPALWVPTKRIANPTIFREILKKEFAAVNNLDCCHEAY
jgi:hypothetical protein